MDLCLWVGRPKNPRGAPGSICSIINTAIDVITGFDSRRNQRTDIGVYTFDSLNGGPDILDISTALGADQRFRLSDDNVRFYDCGGVEFFL